MSKRIPIADVTVRCSPLVRQPLTEREALDLAVVFKALGDPVRLRLLSLIASHAGGEACVCDIADVVDVSQPTVSHHLKVLRTAGLLESERRASWVYYRVVPEVLALLAGTLIPDTTVVDPAAGSAARPADGVPAPTAIRLGTDA